MPLQIITGDITLLEVDAIVNAANNSLLGGGGVDGCIHRAAGPALLEECRTLGGCETGSAKVTLAYNLPSKYVIHTVGPVWQGGTAGEEKLLYSCYEKSLALAVEKGCESVAFPLISSGAYGYPGAAAKQIATRAIIDFLEKSERDMMIYLVFFNRKDMHYEGPDFSRIFRENIRNNRAAGVSPNYGMPGKSRVKASFRKEQEDYAPICFDTMLSEVHAPGPSAIGDGFVPKPDESFQQMLFRFIDERGITDVQCYTRSNISRKLFSKIRSDVNYKPSKSTVISLAIGLELSREETDELLNRAGFALSKSMMGDQIIAWYIDKGDYDVFAINEALFTYDQPLLGSV